MTKAAATVNELAVAGARVHRLGLPRTWAKFATKIANNFVHFVAVLPPLVAAHSSSHL